MEVIKLNLIPGKACPVVHVSQFDDGREFKAELYEGVNVYTLDGTETLTAIVKKPDGNEVTAAVTNTSDNYVIITTTEQMTACAGGNLGTLRIEKGAVTIATLNFILECQASPDTGIQSDSEIHNLEAQVNQMVEDAVAEQYDSNNVLFDTAPTSGHGVPYAVTSGGLWSWMRDLPLIAYPTASGAIATFDTSLALPLQDCTIAINAVQESGTPTPSSPKAISGFTGANIKVAGNLISSDLYQFSSRTVILGETGNTYSLNLVPATYTISFKRPTGVQFSVTLHEQGGANTDILPSGSATSATFTITEFGAYRISIYRNSGVTTSDISDVMLVGGSEVKPYTAYTAPTTTAITWQDEAGTVSEGSLDVTTGKLTVVNGSMGAGVYQITPIPINQLSGTNNVFCDTGDTSVVYACSLKDYIDSQ